MPLTPEQSAALKELRRRGSLNDEQVAAYEELERRNKSQLQLQHEHNINRAAEADTQHGQVAVDARMVAEPVRALGMFGGPAGAMVGEDVAQNIEMAGGAREAINPLAIGAQAVIPGAVAGLGMAARPLAKKLYGSALKMSTTLKAGKRASILETGLNEGRIPTTGSLTKSVARQKEIEKEIADKIAARPQAPIDTAKVASRVDEIAPQFETVTPESNRAILQGAKDEFVRNYPALGASAAQELKKKTYKQLGKTAYGELKNADKESQKALARGLKEELEVYWPELKGLNANDSALFDLNRALGQAAQRIGNRDIIGLGITTKTIAGGPAGFVLGLMDTPRVKSLLAIAIDKARHLEKASPVATAAIGRGITMPSNYEE